VKLLVVCRGGPGLGRVVPCYGLVQTLRTTCPTDALFASYGAGYAYLKHVGEQVMDLGPPANLFIDSVSAQAVEVERLASDVGAELILVDGEFFLPVTLAHLGVPVVYLANPHDLIGPPNAFRRVNRLLLAHCRAVVISTLSSAGVRLVDVIPGVPCLEVPAITKLFPTSSPGGAGSPRALVSMGGGSVGVNPAFREATDQALHATIHALSGLAGERRISGATVVLGADGHYTASAGQEWLTVLRGPVELTALYATHDVFIARAGRNACAEALYCGIPSVFLPVTADPHRASEQANNAAAAAALSSHVSAVPNWRDAASLRGAIEVAIQYGASRASRVSHRGNDDAASFILGFLAARPPLPTP